LHYSCRAAVVADGLVSRHALQVAVSHRLPETFSHHIVVP
jgi:hypothetical protein